MAPPVRKERAIMSVGRQPVWVYRCNTGKPKGISDVPGFKGNPFAGVIV
jgi:hypothetical protein